MSRTWKLGVAALAVLLLANDSRADWATLSFKAPAREGGALVFRGEQGIASVSVLAPEVVRVRFSPTPSFGRDHSYAVVSRELGAQSWDSLEPPMPRKYRIQSKAQR